MSLEQEASDRKAKLALLRAKRQNVTVTDPEDVKKPKLDRQTFGEEEEEEYIARVIQQDTVEEVSKEIELEIVSRYESLLRQDWRVESPEFLARDKVYNMTHDKTHDKELEEYWDKLRVAELELQKITNDKIKEMRKELVANK